MGLKENEKSIDFWLFITAVMLGSIGLVMVYSSSMYLSMEKMGYGSYYFKKQALHFIIGISVMFFLMRVNYHGYAKLGKPLLLITFAMLLVLVFKRVIEGGGIHRWFRFGSFGFQPSEFMKVILIIYLSAKLSSIGERVRDFKQGFLPLFCVVGVTFAMIVLEPDLGSAGLLLAIGLYIMFIGRVKLIHMIMAIVPAIGAIAITILTVPYMQKRLMLFLDPEKGYQIKQSLIGIGSGGLFGVGLGNSTQKFLFLPERHTDFVFSILAEELGFIGVIIVLSLMFFFIVRGHKIAECSPDRFGFLLGSGLSVLLGLQMFINIGVVSGILPTKGITLPFMSYGGSSLVMSFVATGILLNISRMGSYELHLSREFGTRLHTRKVTI